MGTAAAPDRTPVKVPGGHTWRNVSAGFSHTCGATTTNAAYCWGNNSNFQLGNGQASFAPQPLTKVVGGLSWRQVFVGSGFIAASSDAPDHALSCGITTADRVYCWGSGAASSTPKEIIGARRYSQLGVGTEGCAVRFTGVIDCWTSESITKVASGTLRFLRVTVSGLQAHKCAVGTDNKAYCWGPRTQTGSSAPERRIRVPRPWRSRRRSERPVTEQSDGGHAQAWPLTSFRVTETAVMRIHGQWTPATRGSLTMRDTANHESRSFPRRGWVADRKNDPKGPFGGCRIA